MHSLIAARPDRKLMLRRPQISGNHQLPTTSTSLSPPAATMRHYASRKGRFAISTELMLKLSAVLNFIFLVLWIFSGVLQSSGTSNRNQSLMIRGDERTWHGGYPNAVDHKGSCWCGAEDQYCMCTPNVAIDLIIASHDETHVWLVRRKDTNQLATMGGFVDVSETVEQAVHRELKEEMNIELLKGEPPRLHGVYSDPRRDNRRRNASVVFVVKLEHSIQPKAADDAKDVQKISLGEIENYDFFADHKTILLDYRESLQRGGPGLATRETLKKLDSSNEAAIDIQRSVCIK